MIRGVLGQALGLTDREFDALQGYYRASALFNMINRLNDSFRTELESEEYNRRQHRAVGVTAATLEAYACRICGQASKA